MGAAEDRELEELREYLPLLRALKRLLSTEQQQVASDSSQQKSRKARPSTHGLNSDEIAEIEARVAKHMKRQGVSLK